MKKRSLLALLVCLFVVASRPFGGRAASAQEVDEAESPVEPPSTDDDAVCFPTCPIGYVCHPQRRDCVSACNPPCADWEVCSEEGECVQRRGAEAQPSGEVGDRRFRIVLLGRFGLVGDSRTTVEFPLVNAEELQIKYKPGATLGFDLRFEKPVAKHLSVGGLISNYWLRAPSKGGGAATRSLNPNDYAFDIAPFVKPRYPFRIGKKEAEAYLVVHFGGSLRQAVRSVEFVVSGGAIETISADSGIVGGFNWGVSPGFRDLRHAARRPSGRIRLRVQLVQARSYVRAEDSPRSGHASIRIHVCLLRRVAPRPALVPAVRASRFRASVLVRRSDDEGARSNRVVGVPVPLQCSSRAGRTTFRERKRGARGEHLARACRGLLSSLPQWLRLPS